MEIQDRILFYNNIGIASICFFVFISTAMDSVLLVVVVVVVVVVVEVVVARVRLWSLLWRPIPKPNPKDIPTIIRPAPTDAATATGTIFEVVPAAAPTPPEYFIKIYNDKTS
jgi:hypothetical protein